jgi:hypothetical protein
MESTQKRKPMSNPINFCQEAMKHGIRYEFLIEAKESINCTNLARLFIGKSSRGGLSTDIIETWIATFEYVRDHPDKEDHDQYTARRFEPTQEYHDYVELIKKPISDEVVESWKNMSSSALGKIAPNYGYKIGISNAIAIKTLHERMFKMVERRKNNIWNKNFDIIVDDTNPNYRFMNVPDLRKLCKDRNLQNAHIKTKDGLISLLERNPNAVYDGDDKMNYDKMTMTELKILAKDRGFTSYNNLKKDELIKNHTDFDELENDKESIDYGGCEESKDNREEDGGASESKEIEIIVNEVSESKENEFSINEYKLILKNGNNFMIPIRKDGMINATELCKAGGKKFNDYQRLKQTQEFISELEKSENIPESKLIIVKHGGISKSIDSLNPKLQGTWVHPLIATNLASWISSDFAIKVSIWIEEWKQNNHNKNIYYNELNNIKPDYNLQKEKEIKLRLQKELNGKIEIETESGFIDLLTDTEIIEIKVGKQWKHAVGQILIYSFEYPIHKKRIHLFDIEFDKNINEKCKIYDIDVSYEKF